MHEYCLDWTEDALTWSIDGDDLRTLNRKDTWNSTANRFDYPQTPSRVMLSLWPAGLPTNAKGTVDWAGGEIDWNSPHMRNGYYYANVEEVSIECYDPPPMAKKSGSKTYKYTDYAGTNNTVEISNDVVILGSLMGTGEEPGDAPKSGDPEPTEDVAMVPGGNPGGGNRAEATGNGFVSGPQATDGASAGNVDAGGNSRQFIQGDITVSVGSSLESRLGGSILAVVVAIVGLVAL